MSECLDLLLVASSFFCFLQIIDIGFLKFSEYQGFYKFVSGFIWYLFIHDHRERNGISQKPQTSRHQISSVFLRVGDML